MWPGDIIAGYGGGVVVIPANIAEAVAVDVTDTTAFEDFVASEVQDGRFFAVL